MSAFRSLGLALYLALFCTWPFVANASNWSAIVDTHYEMGEGDSRITARAQALEKLKLLAANEVGTYVETDTALSSEGLSESVRMISASMVKLTDIRDEILVKSGGQLVLYVKASASVDESELRARIRALQEDREKAVRIAQLSRDNQALQSELSRLQQEMKSSGSTTGLATLVSQTNETIRQVEQTGATVNQVFSKGSLLAMADQQSVEMDNRKREFERILFRSYYETQFQTQIVSVNRSGQKVLVKVAVSYALKNKDQVVKLLSDNFHIWSKGNGVNLTAGFNDNGIAEKFPLAEGLLKWLSHSRLMAEVKLGSKISVFPLSYGYDSRSWDPVFESSTKEPNSFMVLLSADGSQDHFCEKCRSYPNPLTIHLSVTEAETIDAIEVNVYREELRGTSWVRI